MSVCVCRGGGEGMFYGYHGFQVYFPVPLLSLCVMDGKMYGWMSGWMDGWTDGWMD